LLELIDKLALKIENVDKEFFQRVWSTDKEVYKNRLIAIGFENLENVLDAGIGFGQWSVRLTELNKKVEGIELNKNRVKIAKAVSSYYKIDNLHISEGSITKLPYIKNTFDGIFCYSVIYHTDYIKSLNEFFRVLKPGGKLYFFTNDYGWYFYNLIEGHNSSKNFSSRRMALETFWSTARYNFTSKISKGKQHILSKNKAIKILRDIGFKKIQAEKEGEINISNIEIKSFYPKKKYGLTNVYEILCEK